MKSPNILYGPAFDWEEGQRAMLKVVDKDGEINWRAAFYADPGVMKCPGCSEHLWGEGIVVECPVCAHVWETRNYSRTYMDELLADETEGPKYRVALERRTLE